MQHTLPSGREEDEDPVPSTMPTGGWSRMATVLTELAIHHIVVEDLEAARRSSIDAIALVELVEDELTRADLSVKLGEVFLEVSDPTAAKDRFGTAIALLDNLDDRSGAALARVGLARALRALEDPRARTMLEDAGTMFEDLGNVEAVRFIDSELRELESTFHESWSSFQSRSG